MTTKPRILVTSAAGRNGSAAVLELLGKGFPVRAFVRRKDARSETLRKAGAEIFVGDLFCPFLFRGASWWHVCGRSADRSRSRDLRQGTGVFRDTQPDENNLPVIPTPGAAWA